MKQEIERAVEIFQKRLDNFNRAEKYGGLSQEQKENKFAYETLLTVAQQYLKMDGVEEREHIGAKNNSRFNKKVDGYNEGLHDSRLWNMKKLEKVEEIIKDKLDLNCNCDCEVKPCLIHGDNEAIENLTQAIKNLWEVEG